MHPILFRVGPFTVYAYGVTLVLAFLTAVGFGRRAARALPPGLLAIGPDQLTDFASAALLGGILGGRLFYVLVNRDQFARAWQEIPAIWHGGLIWYGGLAGGLLAGWLYTRTHRLDFLKVMDQFIPFVALGHAIGRLGCFLNGCCYGTPTTAWCGVWMPGQAARVWPTQLFESGGLIAIFFLLRALQQPAWLRRPGRLFGIYLILYAVLRFDVEFLRGDQVRGWLTLTLPQRISALLLLAGVMLWFLAQPKKVSDTFGPKSA